MKLKARNFLYFVFIMSAATGLAGLPPATASAGGENWVPAGRSITGTRLFIDAGNITRLPGSTVSFWVRSVPDNSAQDDGSPESSARILQEIQKRNFPDYADTEALWEIDCRNDASRVLYFVAHRRDGLEVYSSLTPEAPWTPVMPGGMGESLKQAVCR